MRHIDRQRSGQAKNSRHPPVRLNSSRSAIPKIRISGHQYIDPQGKPRSRQSSQLIRKQCTGRLCRSWDSDSLLQGRDFASRPIRFGSKERTLPRNAGRYLAKRHARDCPSSRRQVQGLSPSRINNVSAVGGHAGLKAVAIRHGARLLIH